MVFLNDSKTIVDPSSFSIKVLVRFLGTTIGYTTSDLVHSVMNDFGLKTFSGYLRSRS
jgi:hypothetical protein